MVEQSGAVRSYPGLKHDHASGVMVEYDGRVYVFGGGPVWIHGTRNGEHLSLTTGSWSATCYMTEDRDRFSGVLWHDCIYLCGGWHASNSIDVYSPRTDTMQSIPGILPEGNSPTVAFVHREELVVLSQYKSAQYRWSEKQPVK